MNILSDLHDIYEAIFHWRMTLCIAISVGLALFLSNRYEAFTGLYFFLTILAGFLIGWYWDSRHNDGLDCDHH